MGLIREYILEHGVVDLSLSRLARGIGSNNRMLIYHFESLDKIVAQAVAEVLERGPLIPRLSELLNAPGPTVERFTAAWEHISDPERLPHLRIFFSHLGLAAERPDQYGGFLEQTRTRWVRVVADALARDVTVTDPEKTAVAIVGLWRGLQVQLIAGEPRSLIDDVHAHALQRLAAV